MVRIQIFLAAALLVLGVAFGVVSNYDTTFQHIHQAESSNYPLQGVKYVGVDYNEGTGEVQYYWARTGGGTLPVSKERPNATIEFGGRTITTTPVRSVQIPARIDIPGSVKTRSLRPTAPVDGRPSYITEHVPKTPLLARIPFERCPYTFTLSPEDVGDRVVVYDGPKKIVFTLLGVNPDDLGPTFSIRVETFDLKTDLLDTSTVTRFGPGRDLVELHPPSPLVERHRYERVSRDTARVISTKVGLVPKSVVNQTQEVFGEVEDVDAACTNPRPLSEVGPEAVERHLEDLAALEGAGAEASVSSPEENSPDGGDVLITVFAALALVSLLIWLGGCCRTAGRAVGVPYA